MHLPKTTILSNCTCYLGEKQASVVQNSLRASYFSRLVLGFLGADLSFDFLAEQEGLGADTNSGDILG